MTYTLLILAILLTGCTNKLYLEVRTDPPGARIVEYGTNHDWGKAPLRLWYKVNDDSVDGNCLTVNGLAAEWPSRTVARSHQHISLCPVSESNHQLLLRHPGGANYAFDVQMGAHHEQMQLERGRNAALERNARANLFQIFQQWIPRTSRSSTGETTVTSPW